MIKAKKIGKNTLANINMETKKTEKLWSTKTKDDKYHLILQEIGVSLILY